MFIKISDDNSRPLYINSDHVRSVLLTEKNARFIFAVPNNYENAPEADSLITTRAAAEYFLMAMESNEGYEPNMPVELSLKSRIANALRYDYQAGADFDVLNAAIGSGHKTTDSFAKALSELINEGVIVKRLTVYQHRAHFTPSPDPSTAAAALDSAPQESSALTAFLNERD